MPDRVWVVPANDGEAVEILRLLGERGEHVLQTHQRWGASWAALEPEILAAVANGAHKVEQIYGVELAGPNAYGAINIDHHRYAEDDRWRPESSLEQVAVILGVPLDRHRLLVAANDRGYIPAMEALGASPEEIEEVRAADRAAQGLTVDDRVHAERDIAKADWLGKRVAVSCPNGVTSWHSDLLYGKATEWLLMAPTMWLYSGDRREDFERLALSEPHWSGGEAAHGYSVVASPSPESQRKIRELFFTH